MKLESGWYMASTSNVKPTYDETIGIIHSLSQGMNGDKRMKAIHGIYRSRLSRNVPWCLDNGNFVNKFDVDYWLEKIDALSEYKNTCIFIAIPDVVGDAQQTINLFSEYRNKIKDFPVAFISQDHIKKYAMKIPWDEFDCLFVGGSDHHKLGAEGGWIIGEAKKRGKWVHVGRVNSPRRILRFWSADSWDGTHLGFCPSSVQSFHASVLQVRSMKKTQQFNFGG